MTIREDVLIKLGFDVVDFDIRPFIKSININFVVEMADVSDNGVVFHLSHVFGHDNIFVTGCSNENVVSFARAFHCDHRNAFHVGLKGANGIALGD